MMRSMHCTQGTQTFTLRTSILTRLSLISDALNVDQWSNYECETLLNFIACDSLRMLQTECLLIKSNLHGMEVLKDPK